MKSSASPTAYPTWRQKGDRSLYLPNCAEFLFTVFAVTKIGAVFVPLNPQYIAEEAEYVLHHSEASIVLTSPELLPLIESVRDNLDENQQGDRHGSQPFRRHALMESFLGGVSQNAPTIRSIPKISRRSLTLPVPRTGPKE